MRPLKLLIVEDSADDAELILRALRRAEFAVDHRRVEDRACFLASLAEGPEIVIADYELPQFSGLEALELVREQAPALPFILVSGMVGEDQAVVAMQRGASDYLLKDRLARLGQAVAAALEHAQLRRERAQTEAALRESEERFRAVVETIHEVFWMTDLGRAHMLYVSPGFDAVWGRPREEVIADPQAWLEAVHPEDRARVKEVAWCQSGGGGYDETYRIVRPNGEFRWIHDKAFPVRSGTGETVRIVGVAEDITQRRNLEAQFLRAQRMEAIGTLAGGIAHDLNNILAPMLMAAGLLKDSASNLRDREMLEMVERSAQRGADIIRQLLTFSRGAEGARVPVQPRHLLKEMSGIVRETFPRNIKFVEEVATDLAAVVADTTQLHQVLVNLCVNARDAMPDGGTLTLTAATVELSEHEVQAKPGAKAGPHVVIKVTDTGSGMPPEIVERIFDPFFTTKDVGKGTGLGLSTVLGIVRSHQGFVTVASEVGRGSVFSVYLPAAPRAPADSTVPFAEQLPPGSGELILVVDDEETIRKAIRRVLESHNYRVVTARNGKEAIATFLRHGEEVNLVLTDVMMPEMDGAALVRSLRLLNARIKIIATSGLEPEGKRGELAGLGAGAVLLKPCGPQELLSAIRTELNRPG